MRKSATRKELTGMTFGRLLVLGKEGQDENGRWFWYARCVCGTITYARTDDLVGGRVKSCGCLRRKLF